MPGNTAGHDSPSEAVRQFDNQLTRLDSGDVGHSVTVDVAILQSPVMLPSRLTGLADRHGQKRRERLNRGRCCQSRHGPDRATCPASGAICRRTQAVPRPYRQRSASYRQFGDSQLTISPGRRGCWLGTHNPLVAGSGPPHGLAHLNK